jgi:hypothetical protein
MIKHFTEFEGRPNGAARGDVRVTLNHKKVFVLNAKAVEVLGHPPSVKLYFDEARKIVGIKPGDPTHRNSFKLKSFVSGHHRSITAAPFCTHFGIKVDSTVLFQVIDMEGDMLTLDITKTVRVGRGSR